MRASTGKTNPFKTRNGQLERASWFSNMYLSEIPKRCPSEVAPLRDTECRDVRAVYVIDVPTTGKEYFEDIDSSSGCRFCRLSNQFLF